jgi:hypothetical protein
MGPRAMVRLLRGWTIGPARPCKHAGLPLPGHRDMGKVLAAEQHIAVQRGATAFRRARKHEETKDGTRTPEF